MTSPYEEHTWKHKLKKRFRIFLVLITLAISGLLFFSAYMGSTNVITSAFTTDILGKEQGGAFPVTGKFTFVPLQFQAKETSIEIHFVEGSGTLSIQDLNVKNLKTATIALVSFEGDIIVGEGGVLSLAGEAATVTLNEGDITKEKKPVKVSFQNLGIEEVTISWISLRELLFTSTGTLEVKGRGSFEVSGEKAEITPFRGNMKIDTEMIALEGEAGNMVLEKNPRVVVSLK